MKRIKTFDEINEYGKPTDVYPGDFSLGQLIKHCNMVSSIFASDEYLDLSDEKTVLKLIERAKKVMGGDTSDASINEVISLLETTAEDMEKTSKEIRGMINRMSTSKWTRAKQFLSDKIDKIKRGPDDM